MTDDMKSEIDRILQGQETVRKIFIIHEKLLTERKRIFDNHNELEDIDSTEFEKVNSLREEYNKLIKTLNDLTKKSNLI